MEEIVDSDFEDEKKEMESEIGEIVFDMATMGDISQQMAEFVVSKFKEFRLARYYTNWNAKFELALASVIRGIVD